jgi:hypothetical protein
MIIRILAAALTFSACVNLGAQTVVDVTASGADKNTVTTLARLFFNSVKH